MNGDGECEKLCDTDVICLNEDGECGLDVECCNGDELCGIFVKCIKGDGDSGMVFMWQNVGSICRREDVDLYLDEVLGTFGIELWDDDVAWDECGMFVLCLNDGGGVYLILTKGRFGFGVMCSSVSGE